MIYLQKIQLQSPENKSQKNLERKSHTHIFTLQQKFLAVMTLLYNFFSINIGLFEEWLPKSMCDLKPVDLIKIGFCYLSLKIGTAAK